MKYIHISEQLLLQLNTNLEKHNNVKGLDGNIKTLKYSTSKMSFIYSVMRLDEIHIRIFYTLKRISYTIKRILLHINTYVYKSFFTNCPDNVTSSSSSYFNSPLNLLSSNSSCELKCQEYYKCPIRIKIVNILLICCLLTEA